MDEGKDEIYQSIGISKLRSNDKIDKYMLRGYNEKIEKTILIFSIVHFKCDKCGESNI